MHLKLLLLLWSIGMMFCSAPCCVLILRLGCWIWVLACDSERFGRCGKSPTSIKHKEWNIFLLCKLKITNMSEKRCRIVCVCVYVHILCVRVCVCVCVYQSLLKPIIWQRTCCRGTSESAGACKPARLRGSTTTHVCVNVLHYFCSHAASQAAPEPCSLVALHTLCDQSRGRKDHHNGLYKRKKL